MHGFTLITIDLVQPVFHACTCRHCLAYVYGPLLQEALDNFRNRWNSHLMRKNKQGGYPSGVPNDLYNLPQLSGWLLSKCSIVHVHQ